MAIKQEYLSLLEEIRQHDKAYFIEASPSISDHAYDLLVKQVEAIERDHPDWVDPTSPTRRVGGGRSLGFKQVNHSSAMLSLANTYSQQELFEFVKRVRKWTGLEKVLFCAELKMDGVAVSVRYEKGIYVQAATRGDGWVGDDVTDNIRTIRSLPLRLDVANPPDILELRAEVFMPHSSFQFANRQKQEAGEELWANPRNAAAGSLKLLDPGEVKKRKLAIIFYSVSAEESTVDLKSQWMSHLFFHQIGLPSFPEKHRVVTDQIEDILLFAKQIEEKRRNLDFDIDGIVVKVDNFALQRELAVTGKSPRWAVAYKFAPEQAITQVLEITVQVGRTGVITPVAELKPVFLAGSTISRATLHNQAEVERKDVRVGDTVVIEKGGDVIPKVVQVEIGKRPVGTIPWKMPYACLVCHTPLLHKAGEVAIRCPNPDCKDQLLRRLIHFVSKGGMDIEHMGPRVIEQLFEKGLLGSIADIYTLTKENFALLEGFKEKSIYNLVTSIDKSRKTTLPRFIYSLGIPHVGEGSAELLAEKSGDVETLAKMTVEELIQIDGIGEIMAHSIVHYFQETKHIQEIDRLIALGVVIEKGKKREGHSFGGKSFVLTGTLARYSRAEAIELIKERGGMISGSVGKRTDYLLAGADPGSKQEKARQLGVTTLSEEEFVNLL